MSSDEKPLPFKSWIGSRYHETRFMVLAESAYTWTEDGETFVPDLDHSTGIVEHAIDHLEAASRSMVTVTRALCADAAPNREQRAAAWATVAFNNFVPGSIGHGPRARPSREAWDHARASFLETLPSIRPTRLLVLGKANWNNLPWDHWDQATQTYRLPDGSRILVHHTAHPAAIGMSWTRMVDAIEQLRAASLPD